MKTLIFCLLLAAASAADFRFPVNESETACKLLQFTVTMDLIELEANGTTAKTVNIELDKENVTIAVGSCPKPTDKSTDLELVINDGEANFTLTFSKDSTGVLIMTNKFTFFPDVFFANDDQNMTTVDFPAEMLAQYNESYTCNAVTMGTFPASEANYNLTLTVSDFKVQVFGLDNGTFVDGNECDADKSTTSAQTTGTSTVMTTSSAPVNVNTFTLMDPDTKDACIVLQLSDVINVEYENTNGTMIFAKPMMIPKDAKVSGECANNSKASLILTYGDDVMEFTFSDMKNMSSLDMIEYTVSLDEKRFPDAKNQNMTETLNVTLTGITSSDETFYKCIAMAKVMFTNTKTNVELSNFQVQAFNVNGTFTGTGFECAADMTTTPAQTTTPAVVTSTATPPTPPVNNFTIPGENCILMRTALAITIPYESTKTKDDKVTINIPDIKPDAISGNCNLSSTTQMIEFTFFNDWTMAFIFGIDSDSVEVTADGKKSYALQNISATYVEDAAHFPNIKKAGAKKTISAGKLDQFKVTSSQNSYKCNSKTDIKFDDGTELDVSKFQYRAFNTDNSTNFSDNDVNECAADSDSNSVVPIAVGAALAGLVVIVLIAYLIGRRRSKRSGYESV